MSFAFWVATSLTEKKPSKFKATRTTTIILRTNKWKNTDNESLDSYGHLSVEEKWFRHSFSNQCSLSLAVWNTGHLITSYFEKKLALGDNNGNGIRVKKRIVSFDFDCLRMSFEWYFSAIIITLWIWDQIKKRSSNVVIGLYFIIIVLFQMDILLKEKKCNLNIKKLIDCKIDFAARFSLIYCRWRKKQSDVHINGGQEIKLPLGEKGKPYRRKDPTEKWFSQKIFFRKQRHFTRIKSKND